VNSIEKIVIFDSYYKLLKLLPKRGDRKDIALAVFEYVFEDIEPNSLSDKAETVWSNIKHHLNTSKNRAISGSKGGKTSSKNESKDNKQNSKRLSLYLYIFNSLYLKDKYILINKIEEWLNYKEERGENYKETGLKSLLTQIESNAKKYGEENVIKLIDECMASNYKGLIFTKLKNIKPLPEWVDKEVKSDLMSDEELKEFEKELGVNDD
jgi:hypothetical protein